MIYRPENFRNVRFCSCQGREEKSHSPERDQHCLPCPEYSPTVCSLTAPSCGLLCASSLSFHHCSGSPAAYSAALSLCRDPRELQMSFSLFTCSPYSRRGAQEREESYRAKGGCFGLPMAGCPSLGIPCWGCECPDFC